MRVEFLGQLLLDRRITTSKSRGTTFRVSSALIWGWFSFGIHRLLDVMHVNAFWRFSVLRVFVRFTGLRYETNAHFGTNTSIVC